MSTKTEEESRIKGASDFALALITNLDPKDLVEAVTAAIVAYLHLYQKDVYGQIGCAHAVQRWLDGERLHEAHEH